MLFTVHMSSTYIKNCHLVFVVIIFFFLHQLCAIDVFQFSVLDEKVEWRKKLDKYILMNIRNNLLIYVYIYCFNVYFTNIFWVPLLLFILIKYISRLMMYFGFTNICLICFAFFNKDFCWDHTKKFRIFLISQI